MEQNLKEFNGKLKEAIKEGYIIPLEANKARKFFKKEGNTDILQKIELKKQDRKKVNRIKNTKWHQLSELEAMQTIVIQNRSLIQIQKEIKGWIVFMGIITIIGIIGAIILSFS